MEFLKRLIGAIAVFVGCIVCVRAASDKYYGTLEKELGKIGKVSFIGGDSEKEALSGLSGKEQVKNISGQEFAFGKTINVSKRSKIYWQNDRRLINKKPVKKGDTLLVVFWAKGTKAPQFVDDGAGAVIQPYIHSRVGKFHKGRVTNFYRSRELSENWQKFYVKSDPVKMDFAPGDLSIRFMIGHKAQKINIGGIAWVAFPKGIDKHKLPKPNWNYEGHDPNAPWRLEAARRIKKYRMGNMNIEVVDSKGRAVPDATVKVVMKRHAFRFGTAVAVPAFTGKPNWMHMSSKDVDKYRELSAKYFNSITIENALKWHLYDNGRKPESAYAWNDTKECLKYYTDRNIYTRGHVLVWPSFFRTPKRLQAKLKADKKVLKETVNAHITEKMEKFKGLIKDWDVTNETAANRSYMDKLGPMGLVSWYKTAHRVDPEVKLTFNEIKFGPGGMELGSFPQKLLSKKCHGWVDYLIQNNAHLDYLGSQCHGGRVTANFNGKTGPEALWDYYDYLMKRYKKRLQYTEVDVNVSDPDDSEQVSYQADKLRDTIIIAFAHPGFDAITQWGFWAGRHYAPNAALWSKNWKLRPHGKAFINLVYKRWWTNSIKKTGKDGKCTVNGFFGDYEISVKGTRKEFRLSPENNIIRIVLK